MKRTSIVTAVAIALAVYTPQTQAQGFLNGLADKAKEKVKERVEQKVESSVDNALDRVFIATDYFDASINRIAAWAIGMRDTRKAILNACLSPSEQLREAEHQGRYTDRFALVEERKTLPFGPVWDYYCLQQGVPVALDFIDAYNNYEKEELRKR